MTTDRWRLELLTGKPVQTTGTGHVHVPMWLLENRHHHADLHLELRTYEAELLHAKLCFALSRLNPEPPTDPTRRPHSHLTHPREPGRPVLPLTASIGSRAAPSRISPRPFDRHGQASCDRRSRQACPERVR